jgi:phosphate transport system permease protein
MSSTPHTLPPADMPIRRRSAGRMGDQALRAGCVLAAFLVIGVLAGMIIRTTWAAWPAFRTSGFGLITSNAWAPALGHFGGLAFIFGTLVTALIAIVFAVPLSVFLALFLVGVAPGWIAGPLARAIDLLAAVPSVVYGLWGVTQLVPFMSAHVWQPLANHLSFVPLVSDFSSGRNFATAGIVLAIMIVPIITAISREVFATVPSGEQHAAFALGATRWEVLRHTVLGRSAGSVVGATMLGFGRAAGETIAVAYLIGGTPSITAHLFHPGWSIASVIASQFNEAASNPQFRAALIALGVVLFGITLIVNAAAQLIILRLRKS